MREVSFEQVAAYYGIPLPDLHRIGNEVRMRCFLNCGRVEETGERALAIQTEHPAKLWRCHQAGCGRGGNLVSLCDYLKPGAHSDGRPRGERFKAIIADLLAMKTGEATAEPSPGTDESASETVQKPPRHRGNVPLAESANERARGLVNLDEKFVVDVEHLSPKASAYFRKRPFLTPDTCRRWRMGYLPRDTGGDHAGGTMRGKIVYPMLAEDGQVLTWFGRDPEYEAKAQEWIAGGKEGTEPAKYHFVKGFERGHELFGQHRLSDEAFRERARAIGLFVVPGPNDVLALDVLGGAAVGLCGETVTTEQVERLATAAGAMEAVVTVMFDVSEEGELRMRQALVELAQRCPVRLAWSQAMHGGAFKGKKTDSLTTEEWERIRQCLLGTRSPVP